MKRRLGLVVPPLDRALRENVVKPPLNRRNERARAHAAPPENSSSYLRTHTKA